MSEKEAGSLLKTTGWIILLLVVVGLVKFGSAALGRAQAEKDYAAKVKADAISDKISAAINATPPVQWQNFSEKGLTFKAPFPLDRVEMPMNKETNVEGKLSSMTAYQGESGGISIVLLYAEYKPGFHIDLESGAKAMLGGLANGLGSDLTEVKYQPTSVKGLPAKLATTSFLNKNGKSGVSENVPVKSLFVLAGTDLVELVVLQTGSNPNIPGIINEILNSVQMVAPKAAATPKPPEMTVYHLAVTPIYPPRVANDPKSNTPATAKVSFVLQNTSGKTLRASSGNLTIVDALNNPVAGFSYEILDPMAPGSAVTIAKNVPEDLDSNVWYNPKWEKLLTVKLENLTPKVVVNKAVYSESK